MKRTLLHITLVIVLMVATLAGCKDDNSSNTYPYITYQHSVWTFDNYNREIKVPEGYVLNQGNSYEWVETESGYNLVMHFEKE